VAGNRPFDRAILVTSPDLDVTYRTCTGTELGDCAVVLETGERRKAHAGLLGGRLDHYLADRSGRS
jgi:hypothetical protein